MNCRRNVTSTGRVRDQPGISTLLLILWQNTTCLSTFYESSRSLMLGYELTLLSSFKLMFSLFGPFMLKLVIYSNFNVIEKKAGHFLMDIKMWDKLKQAEAVDGSEAVNGSVETFCKIVGLMVSLNCRLHCYFRKGTCNLFGKLFWILLWFAAIYIIIITVTVAIIIFILS